MKAFIRTIALLSVLPRYAWWCAMARLVGQDAALLGASQALAGAAGLWGRYRRVAFLRLVVDHCDESACVEFGVLFSQCEARLEANVYVGPYCQLGRVHIGADTLLASGVQIPSGPETHGTSRLDVPIRLQPGQLRTVRIGRDCWIASGAVVLADIGDQTIVAAGAVVTRALPARVIAAGVPATVIKERTS